MITIETVLDKVLAYNATANFDIIKKAYIFSREAHCSQRRIEVLRISNIRWRLPILLPT